MVLLPLQETKGVVGPRLMKGFGCSVGLDTNSEAEQLIDCGPNFRYNHSCQHSVLGSLCFTWMS